MLRCLLIIFYLMMLFSCASINQLVNKEENNNHGQLETIFSFNNGEIEYGKEYDEDGNLVEEYFYKNGELFISKEYYKNGKIETETNFKDNHYIEYDKDGNIEVEAALPEWTLALMNMGDFMSDFTYFTDLAEVPEGNGILKEYFDNGNLKEEVIYKNGKLDGVFREYFENGSIKSEGTFKQGLLDGELKEYYILSQ